MLNIEEAAHEISKSKHLVILTGAGISADSGIPTFRGKENGLWRKHRPEDLATPAAFARDPLVVWQWYNYRKKLIASKEPNDGHYALAELQRQCKAMLITQNVDGFHRQVHPDSVIEMHGNIFRARCTRCLKKQKLPRYNDDEPLCQFCENLLRPDIVWFTESLDAEVMSQISHHVSVCDVLLIVGTSGVVQPAAGFASIVKNNGGCLIEVNIETSQKEHNYLPLEGRAVDILPSLVELVASSKEE